MQTVCLRHRVRQRLARPFEDGFDGLRGQLAAAARAGAVGGGGDQRLAAGCAAYVHQCHRDPAMRRVALLDGPAAGRSAAGRWMEQMGPEIAPAERVLLEGALYGAAAALEAAPGADRAAELQRIVTRIALALCAEEGA